MHTRVIKLRCQCAFCCIAMSHPVLPSHYARVWAQARPWHQGVRLSQPLCLSLGVDMSVDEAAVAYWLKELEPAFTQVPIRPHRQCAQFLSVLVLAQDLQVAKRIIALLLVNELRNLGDLRHADPPHEWMWAERLSPESLEHLQQLQSRARQECNFVAPTAKKRARQISRCILLLALCVCIRLRFPFVQVADQGPRDCSAEEISVHFSHRTAA